MAGIGSAIVFINGEISGLNKALGDAERATNRSFGNILAMGQQMGAGMLAAGAGLIGFLGLSAKAAADSEKNQAQLAQVLKSTGGAAGLTAEELNKMSAELSKVTPFEDDAITRGQSLLLTFTNIGKDVFPQATEAMLDMSQVLGQDMQSSAIQLGKALNDPIKGVTALQRVGVSFTAQQKEQIKAMVEAGNVAGAQKLILAELAKEFGGQARKAAETLSGRLEMLKNSFGNLQESIGGHVTPRLNVLLGGMQGVVEKMTEWTEKNPDLAGSLVGVGLGASYLFSGVGSILMVLPGLVQGIMITKNVMTLLGISTNFAAFGMTGFLATLAGFAAVAGIVIGLGALAETFYKLAIGASDCGNFITRFIDSNMRPLGQAIDWASDKLVGLIEKMKEWMGLGGHGIHGEDVMLGPGVTPGRVPGYASGGYAPGGLALVGERGPELVNLPRGARVFNNQESREMIGGGGPQIASAEFHFHNTGRLTAAEATAAMKTAFKELAVRKA